MSMKSILPPAVPFDVEILPGISFTVAPISYFDWIGFETKVDKMISDIVNGLDVLEVLGYGCPIDGFDPEDDGHLQVLRRVLMTYELAYAKVTDWTVEDYETGEKLAISRQTLREALTDPMVGIRFWDGVSRHHYDRLTAKKKSSTVPSGTSAKEPEKTTVTDAPSATCPAPEV